MTCVRVMMPFLTLCFRTLGAIEGGGTVQKEEDGTCSVVGHAMAALPLAPR